MRIRRPIVAGVLGMCLCIDPAAAIAQHGNEPASHAAPASTHESKAAKSPSATGHDAQTPPAAATHDPKTPAPASKAASTPPAPAPKAATASGGPRVVVKKVDSTGSAKGTAPRGANADLDAALKRISERIDGASGEPTRKTPAPSARPRVRLEWRLALDWPSELAEASTAAVEPAAGVPPTGKDPHLALTWE